VLTVDAEVDEELSLFLLSRLHIIVVDLTVFEDKASNVNAIEFQVYKRLLRVVFLDYVELSLEFGKLAQVFFLANFVLIPDSLALFSLGLGQSQSLLLLLLCAQDQRITFLLSFFDPFGLFFGLDCGDLLRFLHGEFALSRNLLLLLRCLLLVFFGLILGRGSFCLSRLSLTLLLLLLEHVGRLLTVLLEEDALLFKHVNLCVFLGFLRRCVLFFGFRNGGCLTRFLILVTLSL